MRAELQRANCVSERAWSVLERMLKLIDVLCERCKFCRPMSLPIYLGCGKLNVSFPLEYYVDNEDVESILESIIAEKCDDFKRIVEGERDYYIFVDGNTVAIIKQEARPVAIELDLGEELTTVRYAQLDFRVGLRLKRRVYIRR